MNARDPMRSIFQFLKLPVPYLPDGARRRAHMSYSRSSTSFWLVRGAISSSFPLHSRNAPRQPVPAKKYAETVAQAMAVIAHVSYDLVRQDLPPALEDIHSGFLGAESGMFSYGALQTSR